jgi:predicted ATPase
VNIELAFVGRTKELAQLRRFFSQAKHVLILGPGGIGKSALVEFVRHELPLVLCPHSVNFSDICQSLETELRLAASDEPIFRRKNRLLRTTAEAKMTIVFDGLGWTTPKLSSFLDCVSERVPIWLCSRSENPGHIGHFWPFLWKFEAIELHPFQISETRALVEEAVRAGAVPAEALSVVDRLHHLAGGNPRIVRQLLEGLATGKYDPAKPFDIRMLDLDRRIHEVFPATALNQRKAGDGV